MSNAECEMPNGLVAEGGLGIGREVLNSPPPVVAEGGRRNAELTCVDAPVNTGGTRLVVSGSLRPGRVLHFAGVDIQYSGGILNVRSGRHGWLDIMPEHPHKAHLLCLPADADSAPAMTDDRGRFRVCETASGGPDLTEYAIRNPQSEIPVVPSPHGAVEAREAHNLQVPGSTPGGANPQSQMAAEPPVCIFGTGGDYVRPWPYPDSAKPRAEIRT